MGLKEKCLHFSFKRIYFPEKTRYIRDRNKRNMSYRREVLMGVMISAKDAAASWGITTRAVTTLCRAGKIPGAKK